MVDTARVKCHPCAQKRSSVIRVLRKGHLSSVCAEKVICHPFAQPRSSVICVPSKGHVSSVCTAKIICHPCAQQRLSVIHVLSRSDVIRVMHALKLSRISSWKRLSKKERKDILKYGSEGLRCGSIEGRGRGDGKR